MAQIENLLGDTYSKMLIQKKINMNREELTENGPITIVAFGDSITHGAFGPDEIDYDSVYWNILRKKINKVREYVPVNVINAGIGGASASGSVKRLDKQVLAHNPDLVIVCFGLNDINGELAKFIDSLKLIFTRIKESGADVIFMTPNMLNTYVAEDTSTEHIEYAKKTADFQNNGKMDLFVESAICLAEKMGVTVCDVYSEWKKKSEKEDIVKHLANRINHPTREMHKLSAYMLFNIIFNQDIQRMDNESTMYKCD